jgi:AraC family transcriptional regulator
MTQPGAYGAHLASRFGLARAPTLVARGLPQGDVAVTEIRCDRTNNGLTAPIPKEDALLVTLQLRDCPAHELWLGGRRVPTGALAPGSVCIYDLQFGPLVNSISPFHNLHFYLPRRALARIAEELEEEAPGEVRQDAGRGVHDDVIHGLGLSLLPALARPAAANGLFVSHLTTSLAAYVARLLSDPRPAAGTETELTLSPRQLSRAQEMIAAHGAYGLSVETLAAECGLPASTFAEAFRRSTGQLPHRWFGELSAERRRH